MQASTKARIRIMNRIAMISSLTTRYEQTDEIVLSARLGVRHTCGVPMKIEQAKLTNKRGHSLISIGWVAVIHVGFVVVISGGLC